MMHDVACRIAVLRDVGRRVQVKREAEAALMPLAARLHAHLHDTLAHRGLVSEGGDVPDRIDQK